MEQATDPRITRRVKFVGQIAILWALAIAGRLVWLQVARHEEYTQTALAQHQHVVSIPAARGEISDRRGDPLAISIQTQSAAVNPQRIKNPEAFANLVGGVLDLDPKPLQERILELQQRAQAKGQSRGFLMIKRHISREQAARLKKLWFGEIIEILRDSKREYPNGLLASHVVGSLDAEGNGNTGIEQRLNEELKGRPGRMKVLHDSLQSRYMSWIEDEGLQGVNLRISIDRSIQHEAERALAQGVAAAHARRGTVVVMDPSNGELLALANYPSFDPRVEKPATREEFEARQNMAVMAPVEPGSVMKMITVTMGLDTGKFQETTPIYCENGAFPRPGRRPIHDAHRYGTLDTAMVLIKSSNIGVTKISLACGARTLYDYLRAFGIGERTGIELPGETRGQLRPFECKHKNDDWCWSPVSHEYISFGHEVSATALQLARAVSVVANGGLLVQPHLVTGRQRPRPDGSLEEVPLGIPEPYRVLRAETAHTVRRIMQRVVIEGTGKRARLAGYTSGGKTGSAELFVRGVGWVKNRHNSSFIGFAPVTNPRIVVVVTISDTPLQGGIAAAPVFQQVASNALRILNVPKDDPESDIKPNQQMPADRMEVVEKPAPLQIADQPSPAPESSRASLAPAAEELIAGPTVPDFLGKPLLAVMRESAARNLPLEIYGSGIARVQFPEPGAILPAGKKVRVQFARP